MNYSTEFIIDDPFLDEEGYAVIWVQATPTTCMDHLECSVVDDSGDEGVTGMVITNTTGIHLALLISYTVSHFNYTVKNELL